MSLFSKFFKSKKAESQSVEEHQLDEVTLDSNKKELETEAETAVPNVSAYPADIPSALLAIIAERGHGVLLQPILLNILEDYQLFQGNRALKNSLKQIQNGSYINSIIQSTNWELDYLEISHRISNELGIQGRYAKYLVSSMGYGLGLTNNLPQLSEEEESTHDKKGSINVETEEHNVTEYNPHNELINYILPKDGFSDSREDTLFQTLKDYDSTDSKLPIILQDDSGNGVPEIVDLSNCPHILIGGATMTGKSVLMHSMITSLIFHKHPSDLKLVLLDGKGLEFGCYESLSKYFLAKRGDVSDCVITDYSQALETFISMVIEIDNRMDLLKNARTRNIEAYNKLFNERKLNPSEGHRHLPYLVIFVDEFSTFLSSEFEKMVTVIGSKGASVGIHMIISTSQIDKDTVKLQIRQHFPQRIAFKTLSTSASRLLLNNGSSTKLSSRGNAIWGDTSGEGIEVSTPDYHYEAISKLIEYIVHQDGYDAPYILPEEVAELMPPVTFDKWDPLLEEVSRHIVATGFASTSAVQRKFEIGYNRAGRLMDQLENLKIVGPAYGGKPRSILVDSIQLEKILQRLI